MESQFEFPPAARIYIDEWMKVREIGDQKALAKIMHRSEGAISKKLKRPDLIDLQWLAEFAQAFSIEVILLFQNPLEMREVPPALRPNLSALMRVAALLDDRELDSLISILSKGRADAPPLEHDPEHAKGQPATSR